MNQENRCSCETDTFDVEKYGKRVLSGTHRGGRVHNEAGIFPRLMSLEVSLSVCLFLPVTDDMGSVASPSADSRGNFSMKSPFEPVKPRPVRQKMCDLGLTSSVGAATLHRAHIRVLMCGLIVRG